MISRVPKYHQITKNLHHVNVTTLNYLEHVVQEDGHIYAFNGEVPISFDDNHWSQMFIRDFTPTLWRILVNNPLFKNFVKTQKS